MRVVKHTDVPELIRLSVQLGYSVTEDQMMNHLDKIMDDSNHSVYVSENGSGGLNGWVHIFGKHLLQSRYAEIGGLVVDNESRNHGIGKALMKYCKDWAKDHGYTVIRIRSNGKRKEAHQFYKRIGYKNTKWQEVFDLKI